MFGFVKWLFVVIGVVIAGLFAGIMLRAELLKDVSVGSVLRAPQLLIIAFQSRDFLALCVQGIPTLLIPCLALFAVFDLRNRSGFGSARWARESEIKKAGLRANEGLILGKLRGKWLRYNNDTNSVIIAPPGLYKTSSVIIPTLLTTNASCVVLDVKKELWAKTAGYRQTHGQECYLFSPFDEQSHRYNPFSAADQSSETKRYDEYQRIAYTLFKEDEGTKRDIWIPAARSLFIALALYFAEAENTTPTIGAILRKSKHPDTIRELRELIKEASGRYSEALVSDISEYISAPEKQRMGVQQTLTTALQIWSNPVVDAATSASDFALSDLAKKKITIYVGVETANITRAAPILLLLFEQAAMVNTLKERDNVKKHKIRLLIDEFLRLGKSTVLVDGLSYFRSYGMPITLCIQSVPQLERVYGVTGAKEILSLCSIRHISTPNDAKEAQAMVTALGQKTAVRRSRSAGKGGASVNKSQSAQNLLHPDKIMTLPSKQAVVLIEGTYPALATKVPWFDKKSFKSRVVDAPKVPMLSIPEALPKYVSTNGSECNDVPEGIDARDIESLLSEYESS